MIVCSCRALTKARVIAAGERLLLEDPYRPVTAGRIFRALGMKATCGICFSLIRSIVAESGLAFTCPEPLASEAEEAILSEEKIAAE